MSGYYAPQQPQQAYGQGGYQQGGYQQGGYQQPQYYQQGPPQPVYVQQQQPQKGGNDCCCGLCAGLACCLCLDCLF
ncbi:hypothetical protein CJU90_3909 [Yarrowia sp. C11]|nr:hypothetical protein CKK34_5521 [Yarrowia sp. E02]KAG5367608.1 hypothetical protein CJU90_3909 [Yarrowia sp. C11]